MKKHLVAVLTVLVLLAVAMTLRAPGSASAFDTVAFGQLPALVNGRVKPLDTVARTSLLMMQGRQRVTNEKGDRVSHLEWLLDVLYRPHVADHYQVFEITHPELLALLDISAETGAGKKRFSLQQFAGKLGDLDRQAKLADGTERALRTSFQRAVAQLRDSVALYQRLQGSVVAFGNDDFLDQLTKLEQRLTRSGASSAAGQTEEAATGEARQLAEFSRMFATMDAFSYFRPIPPAKGADANAWRTVGGTWAESVVNGLPDSAASAFGALGRAWRARDANAFNRAVHSYRAALESDQSGVMSKSKGETRFNSSEPFYTSAVLYVAAFLGGFVSWLKWPETMRRIAFMLVTVAFGLTTLGIATRMWLEARPPVTNLYSSALFVGWGAVALCVILEYAYRNSIGSVTAGIVGFAALVIAHHLALGGDTMEMMRAVLDSNFWLATHVVTIAVGYSATFLAGFLALLYVVRGVATRSLDRATADALGRMIYGVICFATLFSFVGTILGGIWADQSWGRFWGWDPKENGALLIVIWNAIILHVRWAGLVKTRGLACLAIFGNVVTAWSWFGVNMLGVGLHSYGFMDAAFWWLIGFVVSQLAMILLAAVPASKWRSFSP
jgi:ABC-type transport system involved in cytochrome c biogenesis permease subunit